MYRCNECGHLFEDGEQRTYRENVGECHGSPSYQEFSVCPVCGGDYEEVNPCKICGSYDNKKDGEFCETCKIYVKKRFSNFVNHEFTKEERKLLNELYDGEAI